MPRRFVRFLVITLVSLVPTVAGAQVNQQRGATLGGLAGAVAGGLIGDHNNEAGAGAAIGGVVGAVTGGLLGNAKDKEAELNRQHQLYQQQQQLAQVRSAVSIADVVSMSRSGLSDSVIINQVNQRGVQQTLQVPDIIALHQQGISETVITSMQQAPVGMQQVARAPQGVPQRVITPAPVIVEEHYVLPHYAPPHYAPPHYGPRRYHYRHTPSHHHHHHGFHFRF
jgi:hypothetical protein